VNIEQFVRPLPRYTSYPTVPEWGEMDEASYCKALKEGGDRASVYIHIPFCPSQCLYCGCSTIVSRDKKVKQRYLQVLLKEIELIHKVGGRKKVVHLHFGGGSPTVLSQKDIALILDALSIGSDSVLSFEVDPRAMLRKKNYLSMLNQLGFRHISFGVQDFDPYVQKKIGRMQPYEDVKGVFEEARSFSFTSINFDLIYGLPGSKQESFLQTIEKTIELRPHRIALFSYAHMPQIKKHQSIFSLEEMPTPQEKFQIFSASRERLQAAGYIPIGMDHFALPEDQLAKAFEKKQLIRTFQGYMEDRGISQIGLGLTSIGSVGGNFFQNTKDIERYIEEIERGCLPIEKGKICTQDDMVRGYVISQLMSHFEVDKRRFQELFCQSFDHYFSKELVSLDAFFETFFENRKDKLVILEEGALFLRHIASCFDTYLHKSRKQSFSLSI